MIENIPKMTLGILLNNESKKVKGPIRRTNRKTILAAKAKLAMKLLYVFSLYSFSRADSIESPFSKRLLSLKTWSRLKFSVALTQSS